MKYLMNLTVLCLLLISTGCAQEETVDNCGEACSDGVTIETLVNREAKVIKFYDKGFILTTNKDDFEHEFFIHAEDDYILVPCNWIYSYPHNTKVIVSGKKTDCCKMLTFPNERRGFGCKFEITSIKPLTVDNE
ncbi:MAG: hypothetical protein KF845_03255 [Cyclobacteriaceae bacterium]|nr:hypothetical protein [Cyclobacteriaceae bacterium]